MEEKEKPSSDLHDMTNVTTTRLMSLFAVG